MAGGSISTRIQAQWLSFAALVALAACGGGGSDSSTPVGIGPPAPAYVEQNLCVTDLKTLTGAPTYTDPNLLAQSGFPVTTGFPFGCSPKTTTATWKFTPH